MHRARNVILVLMIAAQTLCCQLNLLIMISIVITLMPVILLLASIYHSRRTAQ
jgi:hypothetical protein